MKQLRPRALPTALLLAGALLSRNAAAQSPPDEPLIPDGAPPKQEPLEQSPPPQRPPEQEPLVYRPPSAPPRRAVNALPLVSTDAPPPLIWKWPKFSTADYVVTLSGGAITLAASIIAPRAQHSLTGPIGFDTGVRKALRANRLADRYIFRDASDVGLSLTVTWPFVADALTTAEP